MTGTVQDPFPDDHPLRHDRALLDSIRDLMWKAIQKTLHHNVRPRSAPARTELTLVGGVSAHDIMQEALIGLLRHDPDGVDNWKGLGVRIAQNKAKQAIRSSRAHRRREGLDDIEIASLDMPNADGQPLVDSLAGTSDTEMEALRTVESLERQQRIERMINQTLTDRDRAIVFRIQRGETREDVRKDYDLTAQRIGQIYTQAFDKLRAALRDELPDIP